MEETCNGKKCYSHESVKEVRESIYRKGRTKKLRIYECPECFHWHLTSAVRGKTWDDEYFKEEKTRKVIEKRKKRYDKRGIIDDDV